MQLKGISFVTALAFIFAGVATGALPLQARVLESHDLGQFVPQAGRLSLLTTAREWRTVAASGSVAELTKAGFVQGIDEGLQWSGHPGWSAASLVAQFGDAAKARSELAPNLAALRHYWQTHRNSSYSAFSVPGVRGARGAMFATRTEAGAEIEFTDGPFLYIVSCVYPSSDSNESLKSDLVKAAGTLYARARHS